MPRSRADAARMPRARADAARCCLWNKAFLLQLSSLDMSVKFSIGLTSFSV